MGRAVLRGNLEASDIDRFSEPFVGRAIDDSGCWRGGPCDSLVLTVESNSESKVRSVGHGECDNELVSSKSQYHFIRGDEPAAKFAPGLIKFDSVFGLEAPIAPRDPRRLNERHSSARVFGQLEISWRVFEKTLGRILDDPVRQGNAGLHEDAVQRGGGALGIRRKCADRALPRFRHAADLTFETRGHDQQSD